MFCILPPSEFHALALALIFCILDSVDAGSVLQDALAFCLGKVGDGGEQVNCSLTYLFLVEGLFFGADA